MRVSVRVGVSVITIVASLLGQSAGRARAADAIPSHEARAIATKAHVGAHDARKEKAPTAAKARDTKAPRREPASDAESQRARSALKREIASFGMVALVKAALADEPAATPWAPDASLGPHASSEKAQASMWRGVIDDAVGAGDLRLSSTGDVVLPIRPSTGRVRTIGGGDGVDDVDAFAHRRALAASHGVSTPERSLGTDGTGLETVGERIQRIVRANFGLFRVCYERALADRPELHGRVAVKLVIDPAGAVITSSDAGSTLPDGEVVSCIVRSFATLAFPASGTTITMVYPLTLSPAHTR